MQFYKNNKGFTLIELLVVIAIIGILSTLVTVGARFAIDKAKTSKAQHAVDAIYNAITMLGSDTSLWPGGQTVDEISTTPNKEICGPDAATPSNSCSYGLTDSRAGIVANDGSFSNWGGPYMLVISPDPWGHEYFFDTDYSVDNLSNVPCACCTGCNKNDCKNVVVVGSYGPDGLGKDKIDDTDTDLARGHGCDDIIKIITFQ